MKLPERRENRHNKQDLNESREITSTNRHQNNENVDYDENDKKKLNEKISRTE